MKFQEIIQNFSHGIDDNSGMKSLEYASGKQILIYPRSINSSGDRYYFIARENGRKYLFILSSREEGRSQNGFSGIALQADFLEDGTSLERFEMDHANAAALQSVFAFTKPVLIGTDNSVGLGDRLGIANPGHLRAVLNTGMKVILAQQSIRELERTARTPEAVMDAAIWAVFQEGWREGFGADADHLKTERDIDLMLGAGYTMVTIDPGAYVNNGAAEMSRDELSRHVADLDWELLQDTAGNCIARYENRRIAVSSNFTLCPSGDEVVRAIVKYGGAVSHAAKMHAYILERFPGYPFELELSVDETDSDTTPFEHYFIVAELARLNIKLVSLAPRFIGGFEKGIDYRGDLSRFIDEYIKHVYISELLGPYKISYHSGSDKFSVYQAVGKLKMGRVHVKTAGTSYLEALHTVAQVDPGLFRRMYAFSRDCYESEKRSYHVSANLANVPEERQLEDSSMESLFRNDDVRQVLHVAFGRVLTGKNAAGQPLFKAELMRCLMEHEDLHYAMLEKHFRKHVEPFVR